MVVPLRSVFDIKFSMVVPLSLVFDIKFSMVVLLRSVFDIKFSMVVPLRSVFHIKFLMVVPLGLRAKSCNPADRAVFNKNLVRMFSQEYTRDPTVDKSFKEDPDSGRSL